MGSITEDGARLAQLINEFEEVETRRASTAKVVMLGPARTLVDIFEGLTGRSVQAKGAAPQCVSKFGHDRVQA